MYLYCDLLLIYYDHYVHVNQFVQYVLLMRSIFRGEASERFHSKHARKDYRVRILRSRPFTKMRDRYRIQLMMHRCCVDNIVSKNMELAGSDSSQESSSMMLSSIMSTDFCS